MLKTATKLKCGLDTDFHKISEVCNALGGHEMQTNITQNLDANSAVARINVTAIANGMKRGFDVARVRIVESLRRLSLSPRSAFAHRPADSSLGMIHGGMEPDGISGAEFGRNLERCDLERPDAATISTAAKSTAIKPLYATALKACPWQSLAFNGLGRNQTMVQSLVTS